MYSQTTLTTRLRAAREMHRALQSRTSQITLDLPATLPALLLHDILLVLQTAYVRARTRQGRSRDTFSIAVFLVSLFRMSSQVSSRVVLTLRRVPVVAGRFGVREAARRTRRARRARRVMIEMASVERGRRICQEYSRP